MLNETGKFCFCALTQVLSDDEKRKIYDRHGEEGLKEQAGGGGFDPFSRSVFLWVVPPSLRSGLAPFSPKGSNQPKQNTVMWSSHICQKKLYCPTRALCRMKQRRWCKLVRTEQCVYFTPVHVHTQKNRRAGPEFESTFSYVAVGSCSHFCLVCCSRKFVLAFTWTDFCPCVVSFCNFSSAPVDLQTPHEGAWSSHGQHFEVTILLRTFVLSANFVARREEQISEEKQSSAGALSDAKFARVPTCGIETTEALVRTVKCYRFPHANVCLRRCVLQAGTACKSCFWQSLVKFTLRAAWVHGIGMLFEIRSFPQDTIGKTFLDHWKTFDETPGPGKQFVGLETVGTPVNDRSCGMSVSLVLHTSEGPSNGNNLRHSFLVIAQIKIESTLLNQYARFPSGVWPERDERILICSICGVRINRLTTSYLLDSQPNCTSVTVCKPGLCLLESIWTRMLFSSFWFGVLQFFRGLLVFRRRWRTGAGTGDSERRGCDGRSGRDARRTLLRKLCRGQ